MAEGQVGQSHPAGAALKTVVYTTIFGGSDSLKPAPTGVDAVCFVDDPRTHQNRHGWDLRIARYEEPDPRRAAWRMRCLSDALFPEYDRVIWIDASYALTNVARLLKDSEGADIAALRHHRRGSCYTEGKEIVKVGQAAKGDVTRQLEGYRKQGFNPTHLSVSCILVRSNTEKVRQFNALWAAEIERHRGDNTQLSLDYAAWKQGLTIKALRGSRHHNPYAEHDHADHKKRRRPYDTEVAA